MDVAKKVSALVRRWLRQAKEGEQCINPCHSAAVELAPERGVFSRASENESLDTRSNTVSGSAFHL